MAINASSHALDEPALGSDDIFRRRYPIVMTRTASTGAIPSLLGDLRSDHAGEVGAVMIYRGVLAGSRDPAVRHFASTHLVTERAHLALIESLLPSGSRSLLLPIWRVAGWLTGFLPALAGSNAVHATIHAVETFVVQHYEEQIVKLPRDGLGGALKATLSACQADEARHRDEAHQLQTAPPGMLLSLWTGMVGFGSRAAVQAARRL